MLIRRRRSFSRADGIMRRQPGFDEFSRLVTPTPHSSLVVVVVINVILATNSFVISSSFASTSVHWQ